MAAKMAGWPTYVDKHSPKPVPQHPEHVAQSGSFTFTSAIRKPEPRPVKALKSRSNIDLTVSMAELQVGDVKQPSGTVTEPHRPAHSFKFTLPSPVLEPNSEIQSGVTRPIDVQDLAQKTTTVRPASGLPTAAFTFTTPTQSRSLGPRLPDATLMIDSQKIEALIRAGNFHKLDAATRYLIAAYAKAKSLAAHAEVLKHQSALAESRSQMYELVDAPRDHISLDLLSQEFWVAFDLSCEANKACKKLEAELVGLLENQQLNKSIEKFCLHIAHKPDEGVTGVAGLSPKLEDEDGSKKQKSQMDALSLHPESREHELRQLLSQKRSELLKLEEEVSRISHDLLVQNELLPPR